MCSQVYIQLVKNQTMHVFILHTVYEFGAGVVCAGDGPHQKKAPGVNCRLPEPTEYFGHGSVRYTCREHSDMF